MLISDALIPLLGFFIWDWSLYFILLFYFLDLLAREVITHVKTRKIYEVQQLKNKQKWIRNGTLSALLLIVVVGIIHVAMLFISRGINFPSEIRSFWVYEEMGIQQGYILIPIVAYAAYMQFKMQFMLTGKPRTVLLDSLWKQHIFSLILIGAGACLALLISLIVPLPEIVYVLAIVAGAAGFSYFLEKV